MVAQGYRPIGKNIEHELELDRAVGRGSFESGGEQYGRGRVDRYNSSTGYEAQSGVHLGDYSSVRERGDNILKEFRSEGLRI